MKIIKCMLIILLSTSISMGILKADTIYNSLVADYEFDNGFINSVTDKDDSQNWDNSNNINIENGYLKLINNYDGDLKRYVKTSINTSNVDVLTIEKKTKLTSKDNYTQSTTRLENSFGEKISIEYNNYHYNNGDLSHKLTTENSEHFYIFNRWDYKDANNFKYKISELVKPIWNQWFYEKIIIDFKNKKISYKISKDGVDYKQISIENMHFQRDINTTLQFSSWDWASGSEQYLDYLKIYMDYSHITNTNINLFIKSVDIPFHKEILPQNLTLYYSVDENVSDDTLQVYVDDSELYDFTLKRVENNKTIMGVTIPMQSEGSHTVKLTDGTHFATVDMNLHSIPFREASEEGHFVFDGSGFAGLVAEGKIKVLGLGGTVEAGAKAELGVGKDITNSFDQYIVANGKNSGELAIGFPNEISITGGVEATVAKASLNFLEVATAELNLAEVTVSKSYKRYSVKYPSLLHYPQDSSTIGNLYIPDMIKAILPNSITPTEFITNPVKELVVESYPFEAKGSLVSAGAGIGKEDKVKVSSPALSFKVSIAEFSNLSNITYTKGHDRTFDIDLVKQSYNNFEYNIFNLTLGAFKDYSAVSKEDTSGITFFERGKEYGENVARLGIKLDSAISYPMLGNGISFDKNEVSFILSDEDYATLNKNFGLDAFVNYDFKKPVVMQSWLVSKDLNFDLPVLALSIGAGVGLKGELSLQANRSEKVLAGVAYRVGKNVYPVYHNTFKEGRFLERTIDFTKEYPNGVMIEALKDNIVTIATAIKEKIMGTLKVVSEVAVKTGKKIVDGGTKIAQVVVSGSKDVLSKVSNFSFKVYSAINRSLKRRLNSSLSLQQAINDANLTFVSDLIEVDVNNTDSGENVIFYPQYGDLNDTLLAQYKDGCWNKVPNATMEDDGIKYFVAQSGLFALVKDFPKKADIYTQKIINIPVNSTKTLISNPIMMESGKTASNMDFTIELKNSFSLIDNNITYVQQPLSVSQSFDSDGRVHLDIVTGNYEGEAIVALKSKTGYAKDEFKVYITKPATPKPVENFDINISTNKNSYTIGDIAKVNFNASSVYSNGFVAAVSPSGNQINAQEFNLTQDGNWKITAELTDANGYKHSKTDIISVHGISLEKGWNLIGANILPQALKKPIDIVWKYNSGVWSAYSADVNLSAVIKSDGYPILQSLKNSDGFWVHTDENVTLIGLQNDSDLNLSIEAGWSLHSVPHEVNASSITCQEGGLQSIWKYKDGKWLLYTPEGYKTSFMPFEKIKPNEGYWTDCE